MKEKKKTITTQNTEELHKPESENTRKLPAPVKLKPHHNPY
jgi:hypothetical protein